MGAGMNGEQCSNCVCFLAAQGKNYCRFNPPTAFVNVTPQGIQECSAYPIVAANYWCRQFEEPKIVVAQGLLN